MARAVRIGLCAALLCSFCACIRISFRRPLSPDEAAQEAEVQRFYIQVGTAFATGDPDALADLFSPAITRPMTQDKIRDWARDFFARYGRARFHITSLSFDELGYARAVVTLKYRVEPAKVEGAFGGVEADQLERRDGRWRIASWEADPR